MSSVTGIFDPDSADPSVLVGSRIAVVGYRSQGRSRALDLRAKLGRAGS
jgi:ketol-acid reductoisomerase